MRYILGALVSTAAIGLASLGYAADESATTSTTMESKTNGGYEATSKSSEETPDGTDKSTSTKVNVDVNSNGKVDKTVKTESVTDPKGMWNKKTDKSESRIQEKSNGGYKQTTIIQHTDRSGTDTYYTTVTDVNVDSNGNVTSTVNSEKTTKPKGWFNKTVASSKTKTVNGTVVMHTEETN